MASSGTAMIAKSRLRTIHNQGPFIQLYIAITPHASKLQRRQVTRHFSSSPRSYWPQSDGNESFGIRLRRALNKTKIKWYPIPIGVGIGFLGLAQAYRLNETEKLRRQEEEEYGYVKFSETENEEKDSEGRPKRRQRIRPTGPWQVQVMSTLPLKAISRVWGWFNNLTIPYYLRVPGYKLYGKIFGVNFSEVSEPDLHVYPNLASFFYRTLKPGSRPLDPNQNALLSPADGRVLQYGIIDSGEVEQVKGMTYNVDALLGTSTSNPETTPNPQHPSNIFTPQTGEPKLNTTHHKDGEDEVIRHDEEFARINGISYTLPNLFSGPKGEQLKHAKSSDASTASTAASEAEVRADLALAERPWYMRLTSEHKTALYYVVVYLAPGDYHRFHSPTAWVAEKRRHFAGELYSVSPYLQRTLPGLFTLNERVALLGRWRWGFFSMTPVGATNVGSIKINFDAELRTNSLLTDTAADRAAEEAANRGEPYSGYAEANYSNASPVLGGHALKRGEEMGGFQLGSTIVLVFEAPKGQRPSLDEGWMGDKTKRKGGWNWKVQKGQKVKMGEALGWVDDS